MRAVSAAWLRTITGSVTFRYKAILCTTYQTTNSPGGTRLPIIDGAVTLDGAADIRGSLDLTIPGQYWPATGGNTGLAPQGNEIYVAVQMMLSDAAAETLGLGYFRIKSIGQDEATRSGPIVVRGQDRMSGIVKAKLLAPRVFPAAMTVGAFVSNLVTEVYPNAVIVYDDTTNTLPIGRDITVDSDRYSALASVAQAYGKLMYFNASGQLAFVTIPNPTAFVARLVNGRGGTLVEAPRELSDEGVVNAVVARGDGADTTGGAYGVSIDTNPDNPTSYVSPFGPSPAFITNNLLTTNAQAKNAADAELLLHSGLPYGVSVECVPRPELEPFDPVEVDHSGLSGPERHVLSSVRIPLVAGQTMTLGTRQQSAIIIGGSS